MVGWQFSVKFGGAVDREGTRLLERERCIYMGNVVTNHTAREIRARLIALISLPWVFLWRIILIAYIHVNMSLAPLIVIIHIDTVNLPSRCAQVLRILRRNTFIIVETLELSSPTPKQKQSIHSLLSRRFR